MKYVLRKKETHDIVSDAFDSFARLMDFRVEMDLISETYIDIIEEQIMTKLVIQTQVEENYGAHTWDGKGECPEYWKMKGGNTYVVEDVDQYAGRCHPYVELLDVIEENNEYYREYPILVTEEEDDAVVCEFWETPIICQRNFYGNWFAFTTHRSWLMMPEGKMAEAHRQTA